MGEVGYYCGVAPLHIAPVLTTVFPDLLVCVALTVVVICNSHIITIVICPHKGAIFVALWVVNIVRIVSNMNVIILKEFVPIRVLMWRQTVVEILNEYNTMLEERVTEVELNL